MKTVVTFRYRIVKTSINKKHVTGQTKQLENIQICQFVFKNVRSNWRKNVLTTSFFIYYMTNIYMRLQVRVLSAAYLSQHDELKLELWCLIEDIYIYTCIIQKIAARSQHDY